MSTETDSPTATVSNQFIGCYKDISNGGAEKRALGLCIYCSGQDLYKNNTPQSCSKSCAENIYSYAGLQVTKSHLMLRTIRLFAGQFVLSSDVGVPIAFQQLK